MAGILGYTSHSMYEKLKYQLTPPTIGDFEHLCKYFKRDPGRGWLRIHQTVALRQGDRQTAAIIQHELRDQRVREGIVTLALTYLDEEERTRTAPAIEESRCGGAPSTRHGIRTYGRTWAMPFPKQASLRPRTQTGR